MEFLLNVLLLVKIYAYLAGILSFTLMCTIGVIMAIDELREFLGGPIFKTLKKRRQDRLRKRKEDEAWADYFSELPHNFLASGALDPERDVNNLNQAERLHDDYR